MRRTSYAERCVPLGGNLAYRRAVLAALNEGPRAVLERHGRQGRGGPQARARAAEAARRERAGARCRLGGCGPYSGTWLRVPGHSSYATVLRRRFAAWCRALDRADGRTT